MAKCAICDKSRQTGHRISINRSQVSRRANKTWNANVKKVKVVENGTVKSINVCTRCLRSGKVTRLSSVILGPVAKNALMLWVVTCEFTDIKRHSFGSVFFVT